MDQRASTRLLFLLSTILVFAAAQEEKYNTKYDDINVDAILSNTRLRKQYQNCYLGSAPCVTADAKYFKEKFPDAFITKCRKCTAKQEEFFNKITDWYTQHEPATWKRIVEKTLQDIKKKST